MIDEFRKGNRVKVYIPDEYRSSYAEFHNKTGIIVTKTDEVNYRVLFNEPLGSIGSIGSTSKLLWEVYGRWLKRLYVWRKL